MYTTAKEMREQANSTKTESEKVSRLLILIDEESKFGMYNICLYYGKKNCIWLSYCDVEYITEVLGYKYCPIINSTNEEIGYTISW